MKGEGIVALSMDSKPCDLRREDVNGVGGGGGQV